MMMKIYIPLYVTGHRSHIYGGVKPIYRATFALDENWFGEKC